MMPIFTVSYPNRLQLTGADAHLLAKMEDTVAKRMLPSPVNVLTDGLDVIVTSIGSPVKQLLAREVCIFMIKFELVICGLGCD